MSLCPSIDGIVVMVILIVMTYVLWKSSGIWDLLFHEEESPMQQEQRQRQREWQKEHPFESDTKESLRERDLELARAGDKEAQQFLEAIGVKWN